MGSSKSDIDERDQRILDAAASLIRCQSYDKTTLGDSAEEVGVSRDIVYLHLDSKETLFEALVCRERRQYAET